jgi:hypothetical protein
MTVSRRFADLLGYFNPFAANLAPPQEEDEDTPARKRPRLEASTSISISTAYADTVADAPTTDSVTTASSDDTLAATPTAAAEVALAASLPSTEASCIRRERYSNWKPPPSTVEPVAASSPSTGYSFLRHDRYSDWKPRPRTGEPCLKLKLLPSTTGAGASCVREPYRRWQPEEDAKLTEAIRVLGVAWPSRVAEWVPGRTKLQCCQRWNNTLEPGIKNGVWKPEEDAMLIEAVKRKGYNWLQVSAMVPGRTNQHCRKRWHTRWDSTVARNKGGKWEREEDAKLIEAVKRIGGHWVAVAALVPGRSNIQCRDRWLHTLDPGIKSGKWSPEEDANLITAVQQRGNNWLEVAALVPGRTSLHCQQRWTFYLGPSITQTPIIKRRRKNAVW